MSPQDSHTQKGSGESQTFQADYLGAEADVAPGASLDNSGVVFAGAKEVKLLDHYTKNAGLPNFDLAVPLMNVVTVRVYRYDPSQTADAYSGLKKRGPLRISTIPAAGMARLASR